MRNVIALSIVAFLIFSCNTKCRNTAIGSWKVCHIIYKEKEILGNNLRLNGFEIPIQDSGTMNFTEDSMYYKSFKMNRNKLTNAIIDFVLEEEICYINITDSSDSLFNGLYTLSSDVQRVSIENFNYDEYRLILSSTNTKIYLSRHVLLDSSDMSTQR